jgi:uncharacterized coiled-coil protein SlyX
MPPTNEDLEKQLEANKTLTKQVASHATMIESLHKSLASITSKIQGLQYQAAGLDKALSKLGDNQGTLLSMSAGKPQGPPAIGMNYVTIATKTPLTFEETYNELL